MLRSLKGATSVVYTARIRIDREVRRVPAEAFAPA